MDKKKEHEIKIHKVVYFDEVAASNYITGVNLNTNATDLITSDYEKYILECWNNWWGAERR